VLGFVSGIGSGSGVGSACGSGSGEVGSVGGFVSVMPGRARGAPAPAYYDEIRWGAVTPPAQLGA
jgi:hypothetical protein